MRLLGQWPMGDLTTDPFPATFTGNAELYNAGGAANSADGWVYRLTGDGTTVINRVEMPITPVTPGTIVSLDIAIFKTAATTDRITAYVVAYEDAEGANPDMTEMFAAATGDPGDEWEHLNFHAGDRHQVTAERPFLRVVVEIEAVGDPIVPPAANADWMIDDVTLYADDQMFRRVAEGSFAFTGPNGSSGTPAIAKEQFQAGLGSLGPGFSRFGGKINGFGADDDSDYWYALPHTVTDSAGNVTDRVTITANQDEDPFDFTIVLEWWSRLNRTGITPAVRWWAEVPPGEGEILA